MASKGVDSISQSFKRHHRQDYVLGNMGVRSSQVGTEKGAVHSGHLRTSLCLCVPQAVHE